MTYIDNIAYTLSRTEFIDAHNIDEKMFEDGILFNVAMKNKLLPPVIRYISSQDTGAKLYAQPNVDTNFVRRLIMDLRANLPGIIDTNNKFPDAQLVNSSETMKKLWTKKDEYNYTPITNHDLNTWRKMGLPIRKIRKDTYAYPEANEDFFSRYIPDFRLKYKRNSSGTVDLFTYEKPAESQPVLAYKKGHTISDSGIQFKNSDFPFRKSNLAKLGFTDHYTSEFRKNNLLEFHAVNGIFWYKRYSKLDLSKIHVKYSELNS